MKKKSGKNYLANNIIQACTNNYERRTKEQSRRNTTQQPHNNRIETLNKCSLKRNTGFYVINYIVYMENFTPEIKSVTTKKNITIFKSQVTDSKMEDKTFRWGRPD